MLNALKYNLNGREWIYFLYPLVALVITVFYSIFGLPLITSTVFLGLVIAASTIIPLLLFINLHRDFFTKKGYLIFLTPTKSHVYLGAQIIMIFLGLFFWTATTTYLGIFIANMHAPQSVPVHLIFDFISVRALFEGVLNGFISLFLLLVVFIFSMCVVKIFSFKTFMSYLLIFILSSIIFWALGWIEMGMMILSGAQAHIFWPFVPVAVVEVFEGTLQMYVLLATRALCAAGLFAAASSVLKKHTNI